MTKTKTEITASPVAADRLERFAREDELALYELEELMGGTDCPHGCVVEPDGTCAHRFQSAGLTAGLV